ncbi:Tail completion protein [Rhabdaerophilaceae bacterium]
MSGPASILALKNALHSALLADSAVVALLDQKIFDSPPRGLEPPYLILGDAASRENGTNDGAGEIVDLELVVITRERGSHAALGVSSAVENVLAALPPVLAGVCMPLVILRETLLRHNEGKSLTRAVLRVRAFVHPA